MSGRIERFLERRYVLGERDDDDRFQAIPRIRHASNLGKCQRQNWYKIKRERESEASPYFELGNVFEVMYGAVLASEYGDFTDDEIANLSNKELIDQCDRVHQDVTCNINLGENNGEEVVITGEADWIVQYSGTKPISHVELYENGTRRVEYVDGEETECDADSTPPVDRVIETKTSSIEWREKYGHKFEHEYQVRTYMWAFDALGEIAYMERDNWDELVFDISRDSEIEADMAFRAKRLHMKLLDDEVPDAEPPRDNICKYCAFKAECKMTGGTRWD